MATGSENYLSLVKQAYGGELKLPAFQRDFKWTRRQVVLLYDSIRQCYPIGSIIFLEGSKTELKERAFKGASTKADQSETRQLVLDGQQRLTAGIDLFYGGSEESKSQYFIDLNKLESAVKDSGIDIENEDQVINFLHDLDTDSGYCVARASVKDPFDYLSKRSLLSTILLRPDNSKSRDFYLEKFEEENPQKKSLIRNVVKPYFVISSAPDVPFVSIDSKLQLDAISRIFATLNSTGKVLTPFELVVAVLFAGEVDLREDIFILRELYPYFNNMDATGELVLQTVVMLDGGNHKKSLLPKNLSPHGWKSNNEKAARLLNSVGEMLSEHFGMGLDISPSLIPYDSLFVPMAVVFDRIGYETLPASKKAPARKKLLRWTAGAALSQRYQEGVHNKQISDARTVQRWIEEEDDAYQPEWLKEVSIPVLRSVSPQGAIANLIKCLMNSAELRDPLTNEKVFFGDSKSQIHHIFPTKFVGKLTGWNASTGDRSELVLNLMLLQKETNQRFLNDDPSMQVIDSVQSNSSAAIAAYAAQGIQDEALQIMRKADKTRDDYLNFIKLRETYFENRLKDFGFTQRSDRTVDDDLEES